MRIQQNKMSSMEMTTALHGFHAERTDHERLHVGEANGRRTLSSLFQSMFSWLRSIRLKTAIGEDGCSNRISCEATSTRGPRDWALGTAEIAYLQIDDHIIVSIHW